MRLKHFQRAGSCYLLYLVHVHKPGFVGANVPCRFAPLTSPCWQASPRGLPLFAGRQEHNEIKEKRKSCDDLTLPHMRMLCCQTQQTLKIRTDAHQTTSHTPKINFAQISFHSADNCCQCKAIPSLVKGHSIRNSTKRGHRSLGETSTISSNLSLKCAGISHQKHTDQAHWFRQLMGRGSTAETFSQTEQN